MDAKTNLNHRLASRYASEAPACAPQRSLDDPLGRTAEQIHQPVVGVPSSWNRVVPRHGALMRDAQAIVTRTALHNAADAPVACGRSTYAALHPSPTAHDGGIACDLCDVAEVFKRTPYIADSKPAGRFVAKDLFDGDGVPLLMKTLLDNGFMHRDCMTVTGCAMAENLNSVARTPGQDVVRAADHPLMATEAAVGGPIVLMHDDDDDIIATDAERGSLQLQLSDAEPEHRGAVWQSREMAFGSGYLWKFAQQVGPARHGAVTHPGRAAEKACYADL